MNTIFYHFESIQDLIESLNKMATYRQAMASTTGRDREYHMGKAAAYAEISRMLGYSNLAVTEDENVGRPG